jgi:site-specific recombinase XerD
MQVGALSSIAQAFAPNADWSWLRRKYWRQKNRAKPSRNKRIRVVPAPALYTLGIDLMDTATDGARHAQPFFAASQYRNGLIIALMAARPLRIRNFQDIELRRTLVHRSGTYWLVFGEDETKTGRQVDVEVPRHLTAYLEQYLRVHRNMLLSKRLAGTKPTTAMWVSRSGQKMNEPAMRTNIQSRTKLVFGHAINPHLFRDCAATSFATDDPEHVRCIAPLLGHSRISTSEKHYDQSTMLTAARTFSSTMMKIRSDLLEIFDDEAVRAFLSQAQQLEGPDDGI